MRIFGAALFLAFPCQSVGCSARNVAILFLGSLERLRNLKFKIFAFGSRKGFAADCVGYFFDAAYACSIKSLKEDPITVSLFLFVLLFLSLFLSLYVYFFLSFFVCLSGPLSLSFSVCRVPLALSKYLSLSCIRLAST